MMATVPERTPARSQAASNDAPAGFHSVDFGLDGSGAIASMLRVNTTRLRFGEFGWSSNELRPCTIRSARSRASVKNFLSPSNFKLFRHHAIGVRQHAVAGHDDIAFDAQCRHGSVVAADYSEIVCTTLETGRELTVGSFGVLDDVFVVFGDGLHRRLGLHRHDLVAAGLQLLQQIGQGFGGVLVEVVHQDDALAELVELLHRDVDDGLRRYAP